MTSPSFARWKPLVVAIAGSLAALVGAVLLSRQQPPSPPLIVHHETRLPDPASDRQPADSRLSESQARRLAALETRLRELEEATDAGTAQATTPPEAAAAITPDSGATREQVAQREYDAFRGRVQEHLQESRDPRWSDRAQQALRTDFHDLEHGLGFTMVDVDCRTTSCVATIEWPTYALATQRYTGVLVNPARLNCMRESSLPPPATPNAPYREQVIFDCTSLRAGGN